ncbi:MAG: YceI family protein [Ferruginibacter sp.]
MKNFFLAVLCVCSFSVGFAQKNLLPVDAGSKIHFVIKNFGLNTGGDFSGMKGTIKFDGAKPGESVFDVTVDSKTVDTDNGSRDNHLQEEDYFNASKFPVIRIQSTKIEGTNKANTYMFTGNLTMKGVTKPVHFLFTATAENGGYLFAGDFEINRRDFGVGGNSAVLNDNVKVSLSAFAK